MIGHDSDGTVNPESLPAAQSCVFCERIKSAPLLAANENAVAFLDRYPVSVGHSLIVPRRHEPDYFKLSAVEQQAMFDLVCYVKAELDRAWTPDGYNLGANVGAAAGQTVDHAHLHVIPRYVGDVADPRGGVRWILPARAPYWR